jgi:transcriptional regulator with XRE-family HTH domain
MSTISQRISQLRKELKMTQEELAFKIGTSQRQVSFYETGKNEPTANVLNALADALNTTADYLLGRTEIVERPLRGSGDFDDVEREMVRLLRTQSVEKRKMIVKIIEAAINN